ncbi:DUF4097 family beta strand repeat-containing protein [Streptomyces flavovirens]|uniref:DUF4097 family beta strand repeat-containing protein n=1 Tax=Streptomyces flavovirens TaxID=52258 RepID=UPI003D138B5F
MTVRAFVSESVGPVVLGLGLPAGSVHVEVVDGLPRAEVRLWTADSSGPAAEAVNAARFTERGQTIAVEVPEMPGNVMTQSVRGNRITQTIGTVHGSVTGAVIINGRAVSGGSGGMATVSPIEAWISLPDRSSLAVVSTSADAVVDGEVDRMEFRSTSGSLRASGARTVFASTTSGDVALRRVEERITAHSVSGDLAIDLYGGQGAELSTTSGDVQVRASLTASGSLRATSVSGDVHVSGARNLHVSAHSISGDARTR